jgi:hypothetical protein
MGGRRAGTAALAALLALAASAALSALPACLAVTSPYVRPPPRATLSLRKNDDADGQTPQQVRTSSLFAARDYHVHGLAPGDPLMAASTFRREPDLTSSSF